MFLGKMWKNDFYTNSDVFLDDSVDLTDISDFFADILPFGRDVLAAGAAARRRQKIVIFKLQNQSRQKVKISAKKSKIFSQIHVT